MEIAKKSLEWLYRELKKAKSAKGHAEQKAGVTPEELKNLDEKIAAIDFCIGCVTKEL